MSRRGSCELAIVRSLCQLCPSSSPGSLIPTDLETLSGNLLSWTGQFNLKNGRAGFLTEHEIAQGWQLQVRWDAVYSDAVFEQGKATGAAKNFAAEEGFFEAAGEELVTEGSSGKNSSEKVLESLLRSGVVRVPGFRVLGSVAGDEDRKIPRQISIAEWSPLPPPTDQHALKQAKINHWFTQVRSSWYGKYLFGEGAISMAHSFGRKVRAWDDGEAGPTTTGVGKSRPASVPPVVPSDPASGSEPEGTGGTRPLLSAEQLQQSLFTATPSSASSGPGGLQQLKAGSSAPSGPGGFVSQEVCHNMIATEKNVLARYVKGAFLVAGESFWEFVQQYWPVGRSCESSLRTREESERLVVDKSHFREDLSTTLVVLGDELERDLRVAREETLYRGVNVAMRAAENHMFPEAMGPGTRPNVLEPDRTEALAGIAHWFLQAIGPQRWGAAIFDGGTEGEEEVSTEGPAGGVSVPPPFALPPSAAGEDGEERGQKASEIPVGRKPRADRGRSSNASLLHVEDNDFDHQQLCDWASAIQQDLDAVDGIPDELYDVSVPHISLSDDKERPTVLAEGTARDADVVSPLPAVPSQMGAVSVDIMKDRTGRADMMKEDNDSSVLDEAEVVKPIFATKPKPFSKPILVVDADEEMAAAVVAMLGNDNEQEHQDVRIIHSHEQLLQAMSDATEGKVDMAKVAPSGGGVFQTFAWQKNSGGDGFTVLDPACLDIPHPPKSGQDEREPSGAGKNYFPPDAYRSTYILVLTERDVPPSDRYDLLLQKLAPGEKPQNSQIWQLHPVTVGVGRDNCWHINPDKSGMQFIHQPLLHLY